MKKFVALLVGCMLVFSVTAAYACTALYVGSDLTDNGTVIFARSEDISNSYNKTMHVMEAGAHKAGDVYQGCYGFTWTFTHDTYSFTCFSDDNGAAVENVCPDCDGTHDHMPYGAAGTNEKGVSMSATETIRGCAAVSDVDPNTDEGIEEAEMIAVVLAEADTARAGVELMASIYDTVGANGGSGIFVADANEVWYMENVTGHQYIAVKLSSTLVMSQPNMVVIGMIDLDDTENVIASRDLIAVAQQAATFVGDAEANTINYVASYAPDQAMSTRMTDALNFFNAANNYGEENTYDASAYSLSNVAADGSIVPLYNGIQLDRAFTLQDAIAYYHISSIGYTRNLETHIFQLIPGDTSVTGVVEWVAMDDASWSVFVPYLPMLTTEVAPCVELSTLPAEFVQEQPAEGVYYPTAKTMRVNGERVSVDGFMVFPENWADSMYWTVDVMSNMMNYAGVNADVADEMAAALAAIQQEVIENFFADDGMLAQVKAAEDAAATATACSALLQSAVHQNMVALDLELIAK